MANNTQELKVKQAEQDLLIEGLSKQLKSIDSKLDDLIKTLNDNHQYHLEHYNKISERVTILEAEKDNTRYMISLVAIVLVGLDFLLKYVV